MEQVLCRETLYGKNSFFPLQLKPFLITQCNCTAIGLCSTKKRTNGSAAARETIYISGISDFFEGSDWGVQLIARPGTPYSFHISGNRGCDSNRVHSLSIFHSYCVERRCMGTSTITPCYDVERLKTKTHVGVRPRGVKRIHQAQAEP